MSMVLLRLLFCPPECDLIFRGKKFTVLGPGDSVLHCRTGRLDRLRVAPQQPPLPLSYRGTSPPTVGSWCTCMSPTGTVRSLGSQWVMCFRSPVQCGVPHAICLPSPHLASDLSSPTSQRYRTRHNLPAGDFSLGSFHPAFRAGLAIRNCGDSSSTAPSQ